MPHDEDTEVISAGAGPVVMVVDDELSARATVGRMVRGLGYPTRSCESGRQALRYLRAHPREIRLLLADVGMPRMDGGELAERARDLDPGLHVVLMASNEPQVGELLQGYRDLPVLLKPVGFGELYGRLRELLGSPAMPRGRGPSAGGSARSRAARRTSGRPEP